MEGRPANKRGTFEGWALVAPAAIIYGVFVMVPILGAFAMSCVDVRPGGAGWTPTAANYATALADTVFWRALGHNLVLLAASLLVQIPAAMMLALFVARQARLRAVLRAGYFLPMMITTAAIGRIWMLIFDPAVDGPANLVLAALGVPEAALPEWLGSTRLALPTVIFVISWRYVGFHMVILLAGLMSIPVELYEAARVDGAGPWHCFRYVTLPLMRRPLKISAMLAVVGSLRYFDLVYIMTKGGPDHSSELVATYMFARGLGESGYHSYGATVAVLLALVSFLVIGGAKLFLPREEAVEVVR